MKKIYDGKVYNTETAEEVAHISEGEGFSHYSEDLCKTKKGNWFLYVYGGALTCMAESEGNTTFGSSEIRVFSEEDAKNWLLKNDVVEEYEKHFGKLQEA